MTEELIDVKFSNWTPLFKIGDEAMYAGKKVKIMHRCVNKSYFVNCNGKMQLVEEKELEEL